MKIAITGAHSSGKTTLARLCSKHFGLDLIRGDSMREIMRENFHGKSLLDLDDEENWKLESLNLNGRIKAETEHESFVSDGCTLNSIVYLRAKVGEEFLKTKGFKNFYDSAIESAMNYDFIVYLPPEIPLVDDGFRPTDENFRFKIDEDMKEILKDYKYYTVKGNLEVRLKQIESIVGLVSYGESKNFSSSSGKESITSF